MTTKKNVKTKENGRLSSKFDDWHTPHWVIDAAKKIMGNIDLDPASNTTANAYIQADKFYSVENSGLEHNWFGNIFINPPGGKTARVSNAQIWWQKAVEEFESGRVDNIFWVCFSIEQLNLNPTMFDFLVCTLRHRLKFIKDDYNRPSHGNALVFLSRDRSNNMAFARTFESKGRIFSAIDYKQYLINKRLDLTV